MPFEPVYIWNVYNCFDKYASHLLYLSEDYEFTLKDLCCFDSITSSLFEPWYFDCISVESPTKWSQIFQSLDRFGMNGAKFTHHARPYCSSEDCQDSGWNILLSSLCYMGLKSALPKFFIPFGQELEECIRFREDSLTLNFFQHFDLPERADFLWALKAIFEHFSRFKFKQLSISNLESMEIVPDEIYRLIKSNQLSLVELTLTNISSSVNDNSEYYESPIHLPNIEKLVIHECSGIPEYVLTAGTKLKWLEADPYYTPVVRECLLPENRRAYLFDGGCICISDSEEFVRFLETYPDLECFTGIYPESFKENNRIPQASKALKNLKKFNSFFGCPIQDCIGSSLIESLSITSKRRFRADCQFIKTLQNLVHLEIQPPFNPKKEFLEILQLDRLESLFIADCEFPPKCNKRLYEVLGQLKKLRILKAPNKYVENPILGESVEVLSFCIRNDNLRRGHNDWEVEQMLLTALPLGPGVKYLQIDSYYPKRSSISLYLTHFYPNLVRVKGDRFHFTFPNPKYKVDESKRPLCDGLPEGFEIQIERYYF